MKRPTSSLLMVGTLWLTLVLGCDDTNSNRSQSSGSGASQSNQATTATSPTPAQIEPAIAVSAPDLVAEYKANEVAADEKYKGKRLAVTGRVDSIAKGLFDSMFVTLASGERFGFTSVQAFFNDEHKSRLMTLRKGQQVTIVGTCDGKFGNVALKNAELQ